MFIFKSPANLGGKILNCFSRITAEYFLTVQGKLRISVMIIHIFSKKVIDTWMLVPS